MGRFFQTAPTQFVDNYIYQPPWELMQQAASQKQKIYDAAIASTKLFDNIPIEHLQGEDDVYNVQEKQRYYAENAANIAKAIQNDPARAQQYLNNIDSLQKELQKDMTSGDLSKIIGSAQAYKKWQEDNKKLKEDDASRYTAAERAYLGEYLNAGGNSLSQGFRGEQVTKGIDYEAIRKSLGELKANKIKSTRQTPGGGLYMVETENGLEEMSEERMNGWMLSQILSPENLASLSQSEKFGLGTYRNSEGKIDYDNGSLFAPLRGFARAGHYSQQENSFKMSADSAAIAQMNEAGQNRRWAIDRQDKLMKEEKDRIDAANKTKEDKINAYDIKIAEAIIANDPKAEAVWTNAKNNLTGTTGIYQSNAGSTYDSIETLQEKSASGDKAAQKILDQQLNKFLKQSNINFKDPKQKAIAQDIVGKIKQNKLSVDNLDDYLDKKIPTIYKVENIKPDVKATDNLYKSKLEEIDRKILKIQDKIEFTKNNSSSVLEKGKLRPGYVKDLVSYYNEIKALEKSKEPIQKEYTRKRREALSSPGKNYTTDIDINEKFRNNFKTNIKNILTDFKDDWKDNKSKFSTTYETAPLNIAAQSSINLILRDPEISKELTIEDGTSTEELSEAKAKTLKNIVSVIPPDSRGRYGVIALDKTGKQYKITANVGTPAYTAIMNIAKSNVNPNTAVGLSIMYPSTGIIKQQIEARKTLGQSNVQFDVKSVRGNSYTIKQVGNSDKYKVIDSFGNDQTGNQPVDYINAGIMIDKLDSK